MTSKLSFETATQDCSVLGQFAAARKVGNKDLILRIQKVDGRESLELMQLSKLSWLQRVVRWFGFGDATLTAVSTYLQAHSNEPLLPKRFSYLLDLKSEEAKNLVALGKKAFKKLKADRISGLECFKQCLINHNEKSLYKVYFIWNEGEKKIDLHCYHKEGSGFPGLIHSSPLPIGFFPLTEEENISEIRNKYRIPNINPKRREFAYQDPTFRIKYEIDQNTLGFCYEYGLGVEQDLEKASKNYRSIDADIPSYVTFINTSRVLWKLGKEKEMAIQYLGQAERALNALIAQGKSEEQKYTSQNQEDNAAIVRRDRKHLEKLLTRVQKEQTEQEKFLQA